MHCQSFFVGLDLGLQRNQSQLDSVVRYAVCVPVSILFW